MPHATGFAEITTAAELDALLAPPGRRAATKVRARLHQRDREWLAVSPFCLMATAGADGSCDVSPKGDPPGFALVLDDATVAIPDRAGNNRVDGYRNILSNPQVGLLFLVPGRPDTLRINGTARLLQDAPFFGGMAVGGSRPRLALLVSVTEVFYHCPKAFMRSALWNPESWNPRVLPSVARIVASVQPDSGETEQQLEERYGPGYERGLYPCG